jgi:hypothetical protein
VERIMNAGLGEDATLRAITLFRESLTAINIPNRDMRVVIARCSAVSRKGAMAGIGSVRREQPDDRQQVAAMSAW